MDQPPIQLSSLEKLPSEIQVQIMKGLDLRSLCNLSAASSVLHWEFKLAEGLIVYKVLKDTIGEKLFPMAVARFAASKADWASRQFSGLSRTEIIGRINAFGTTYLSSGAVIYTTSKRDFTVAMAKSVIDHDKLAETWIEAIYTPTGPGGPEMTELVRYRLKRALLIREIIVELLPPELHPLDISDQPSPRDLLWDWFAPWEYFQVLWFQRVIVEAIDTIRPQYLPNFPGLFIHDGAAILAYIHGDLNRDPHHFDKRSLDFLVASYSIADLEYLLFPKEKQSKLSELLTRFEAVLTNHPSSLRLNLKRDERRVLAQSPAKATSLILENMNEHYGPVSTYAWMYSAHISGGQIPDASDFLDDLWLDFQDDELQNMRISWFMMNMFVDLQDQDWEAYGYEVPNLEDTVEALSELEAVKKHLNQTEETEKH